MSVELVDIHQEHVSYMFKGDEVNLILDCDHQNIRLEHLRAQTVEEIQIDPQFCALPWKIIVLLAGKGCSVKIRP